MKNVEAKCANLKPDIDTISEALMYFPNDGDAIKKLQFCDDEEILFEPHVQSKKSKKSVTTEKSVDDLFDFEANVVEEDSKRGATYEVKGFNFYNIS